MTPWLYLQCVVILFLGQLVHLLLVKIPSIKGRARAANVKFSWKAWWKEDWNIVVGNFVLGAIVILGLDQLVNWKPAILDWVKWWFALLGVSGSSIFMAKYGKFEKNLLDVIDKKTNIADNL